MKISTKAAILFALALFSVPQLVLSQNKVLYRTVNKELQDDNVKKQDSIAQVIYKTLDKEDRTGNAGKANPDPRISGIPTVRKNAQGEVSAPAATTPTPAATTTPTPSVAATPTPTPTPTVAPTPTSTPVPYPTTTPAPSPSTYSPQTTPYSSSYSAPAPTASTSTFRSFDDMQKMFRRVDVTLTDNADRAFLRKYSVVIGAFSSYNNADFVRRTFNGLGERVVIARNSQTGTFYALIASYDDQTVALNKLDEITRKYTTGMSRARRISRYGISMDDLWILISQD
ncbi:MAG: SPOR domain-containing protein [Prevotella sp.]|jgi:hypothetical protein|nr:SPOR domain-containing protein [Prevotella sp.]